VRSSHRIRIEPIAVTLFAVPFPVENPPLVARQALAPVLRRSLVELTTVNELIKSSPVLTPVVSPFPPAAQRVRLIGHRPQAAGAR
jgi:hypothetical protein